MNSSSTYLICIRNPLLTLPPLRMERHLCHRIQIDLLSPLQNCITLANLAFANERLHTWLNLYFLSVLQEVTQTDCEAPGLIPPPPLTLAVSFVLVLLLLVRVTENSGALETIETKGMFFSLPERLSQDPLRKEGQGRGCFLAFHRLLFPFSLFHSCREREGAKAPPLNRPSYA